MCEFCTQHGEGKKWYLSMENYSRDLLEQDGRREYMIDFLNGFKARNATSLDQMEWLRRLPLRGVVRFFLTRRQKANHYGQVVPMEEVEQILNMVEGVVRLPCVCRRVTTGNMNARYCYGLTLDARLHAELDDSFSLEVLPVNEAIGSVRKLDKDGLIHSVWTFKTPYIGGLCNCDQDCMSYRVTHAGAYYPTMFRGEYIASVDWEACNGCRNCMRQCQFGAVRYSANNKRVSIDARQCYGCGVCRAACHHNAISLQLRSLNPVAASIW